jgi:signal recognition particle receptor subunit beta
LQKHVAPDADWLFGHLRVDESLRLRFLEPPPMDTFDFIWLRELIEDVIVPGFIVVADATRPDHFGQLIGVLHTVRAAHPDAPCILAVNKQDRSEAWEAEDIRLGLGIPDDIKVVPMIARDFSSVKTVVLELLYQIFRT